MTNIEKLRECFPNTIFIYRKEDDRTTALMCSDEWLESEYKAPDGEDAYNKGYADGMKAQEPKTGHWIDDTKYGGTECSECGKWYPHSTIAKFEIKYCSECGAKMEVEE